MSLNLRLYTLVALCAVLLAGAVSSQEGIYRTGLTRASLLVEHRVVRQIVRELSVLHTTEGCQRAFSSVQPPPPDARLSFWQMFHAYNTTASLYRCPHCRAIRLNGPKVVGALHGHAVDLMAAVPAFGHNGLQRMVSEAAGVILLGWLAEAPCVRDRFPEWIGTGSWRMDQKGRRLPCHFMQGFDFPRLRNNTIVFWQAFPRTEVQRRICTHATGYPFGVSIVRVTETLLQTFFRDLFGIDAASESCPNQCSTALGNHFIAQRHVAQALAKLQVLALAWMLNHYPMMCQYEMWRVDNPDFMTRTRCWAYFLEGVSIVFFCHVTNKIATGSCAADDIYPSFGKKTSTLSLHGIAAAYAALEDAAKK